MVRKKETNSGGLVKKKPPNEQQMGLGRDRTQSITTHIHYTRLNKAKWCDLEQHIDNEEPPMKILKITDDSENNQKHAILHRTLFWKLSDGRIKEIDNKELAAFVNEGTNPFDAEFMILNNEYLADLRSRENHIFSNSCVLDANDSCANKIITNKYQIKISLKTCLGMRSFRHQDIYNHGCVKIINFYQVGDYNIFVREPSTYKLTELIFDKEMEVDDYGKMMRDLGKTMSLFHEKNLLIRFAIPENIFVNIDSYTGERIFLYEEYGTLKYSKDVDPSQIANSDDSDEEAKEQLDDSTLEEDRKNEINLIKKQFMIEDDIQLLGYLLKDAALYQPQFPLIAEEIIKKKYILNEIINHPVFMTVDNFFEYIKNVYEAMEAHKDDGKNAMQKNEFFKKLSHALNYNTIDPGLFVRNSLNFIGKKIKREKRENYEKFANSYLEMIITILNNTEIIVKHPKYVMKLENSSYTPENNFKQQLYINCIVMVEKIHYVLLSLYKQGIFKVTNVKLQDTFKMLVQK